MKAVADIDFKVTLHKKISHTALVSILKNFSLITPLTFNHAYNINLLKFT